MISDKTSYQFNKVAEEYDFVNSLLNDYSFFTDNLPQRRLRALDIGCGSGLLVDTLAPLFEEVSGIDISDDMLAIAKAKRQHSNTFYLNQNAENLNFDKKFDFIVSRTTFHHLSNIPHLIAQIKTLLAENGKLVILDNVSETPTPRSYVYIAGAILGFLPHTHRFGFKNALRIFRHQTSRSWLEHLASDKYLSEKQYHQLFEPLLPNCTFHKKGWAMGIVWHKAL